jgi:hypothetical protein
LLLDGYRRVEEPIRALRISLVRAVIAVDAHGMALAGRME